MLIERPQFDMNIFKPGVAFYLEKHLVKERRSISGPCIVTTAKPLDIEVEYFDEKHNMMMKLPIKVNEVIHKEVKLQHMYVDTPTKDKI